MHSVRRRLTFANVVSSLGVFLLLAGGTAIAAKQLGKKTVGAKQLKKNAVTTAKIKAKAVTKAKIADGAIDGTKLADGSVTTTKIADGSVTGAKIAAGSTPFGQRVARLASSATVSAQEGAKVYPLGSYTQNAGEIDQVFAGIDVSFAASCAPPRLLVAILMLDPANPATPTPNDIIGYLIAEDKNAGAATTRFDFGTYPSFAVSSVIAAPPAQTPHTVYAQIVAGNCSSGTGINVVGGLVDVVGTR